MSHDDAMMCIGSLATIAAFIAGKLIYYTVERVEKRKR